MNPIDQTDPERIENLFQEALNLPPSTRSAFLEHACKDDESLRTAVEELLAASVRVDSNPAWNSGALQNEAAALAAIDSHGNLGLDRYQILERLGAGGMGVVYRAVRKDDRFSKIVALKVVQTEQPSLLERFHQERQILASLEHPNIARLLDVGTTREGLPFLAMEFIDGVPLDGFLKERRPSQREVLQLFRKICGAVSCAHRNLIVHRDLKPANILVTAEGEPKLLDFGIAKLLDDALLRTRTGAAAMTPEYASPEQLLGGAITTSSDIYSLGVLLYEALTGARPYRETTNPVDLAQAILTDAPRTLPGVDRDLENIVQMALRKEPGRRYASAEQLADDLRRYLEGFPVTARPATRAYRASKFVRRNRILIAAAVLVAAAIAGGVTGTVRQARIAARRFDDVRKLANSYLFEFHDAIKDLPGSTPARRLVVKRALEYLDNLARERGNDTALARELASADEKVGAVQGAPGYPSLGDRVGALASYRKALAIREPLASASPQDADIGVELSSSYKRIGELLQLAGDLNGSAAIYRKAVRLLEKLAVAHPASVPVRQALAEVYGFLGNVTGNNDTSNLGDAKGAMELFQKARIIAEKLVAEDPASRDHRMFLSADYFRIAGIQQAMGNNEGAAASFRQAIEMHEQLIREEPLSVLYRRGAAVEYRSLSLVLIRMGNLEQAQKQGDRSAQLFAQLANEDPSNTEAQEALGDSIWSQGYLLAKANDHRNALNHYEAAIAVYTSVTAKHPGNVPPGLRTAYQLSADSAIKTGDASRALRNAQNELEMDGQLLKADAANAGAQRNQGVAYTQIGQVHELLASRGSAEATKRLGEWREARSWYQRGLDVWLDLEKNGTLIPMYAPKLGEARRNVAKCDQVLSGGRSN